MIELRCSCGNPIDVPYDSAGQRLACPRCQRAFRAVASRTAGESQVSTGRLVVCEGPDNPGEQLILMGNGPIDLGSSAGSSVVLRGEHVARQHCRLTRTGDGWHIEESRGAELFVNGVRTAGHDLETGDVLQVGDYELEFAATQPSAVAAGQASGDKDLYELSEETPAWKTSPSVQTFRAPPPSQMAGGVVCPSCQRSLPFGAKICVDCGIDVKTGRALLTSREVDENSLYVHTETVIRGLSWIIPIGIYPVASEGYGSRKPYAIWAFALLTTAVSAFFWISNFGRPLLDRTDTPLMLWSGELTMPPGSGWDPSDDVFSIFQFHWWQPLTYAFLHGGILHLAGNMLFLLVLGSRVNALIGNLKTAILYPLLAIAAGVIYLIAEAHSPRAPMIGASGAIMGLAGMYLVLFPIHRVHMVAWIRLGIFTGFQLSHTIFAVRGFWVVLFYIAFDVLATLIGFRDGVAHWAHLGGFISGAVLALILLVTRQVDARGGDILTAMLGRRAWAILGRPSQRAS